MRVCRFKSAAFRGVEFNSAPRVRLSYKHVPRRSVRDEPTRCSDGQSAVKDPDFFTWNPLEPPQDINAVEPNQSLERNFERARDRSFVRQAYRPVPIVVGPVLGVKPPSGPSPPSPRLGFGGSGNRLPNSSCHKSPLSSIESES